MRTQLEEEKARKVRETAMKVYGYSKGSISKAINAALDDWLHTVEAKKEKPDWNKLIGIAADLNIDSVKAQHLAVELTAKKFKKK